MEEVKPTIIKASGIVLNKMGQLLIVRKKQGDNWISLGGKIKDGETLEQALAREVMEESNLKIINKPKLFHISPIEPAASGTGKTVQIYSYLIEVSGEPMINPEDQIDEFYWLSKRDFLKKKLKLGSVLELYIIPELIKQNLLK